MTESVLMQMCDSIILEYVTCICWPGYSNSAPWFTEMTNANIYKLGMITENG